MGYITQYWLRIFDCDGQEVDYNEWVQMVNNIEQKEYEKNFEYLLNNTSIGIEIINLRTNNDLSDIPDLKTFKETIIQLSTDDGCEFKWFDPDTYMSIISSPLIFKDLTFILNINGEGYDDHYIETWKNGYRQTYINYSKLGKDLLNWLKNMHPSIYLQFIIKYSSEHKSYTDSTEFIVGEPHF
jgi:hypothetical protein